VVTAAATDSDAASKLLGVRTLQPLHRNPLYGLIEQSSKLVKFLVTRPGLSARPYRRAPERIVAAVTGPASRES
jgi:hypothetical protein